MLLLNGQKACGRKINGLLPADFAPGIVNGVTNHRCFDAVFVGGVAPSKSALHTRVALIGFAVFPRHHAHHRVALHLGLEATAHTAVGTGGDHTVLGLAQLNDGFLLQRRGGARLDTGPTRDTVALHEGLILTGRHTAVKPSTR